MKVLDLTARNPQGGGQKTLDSTAVSSDHMHVTVDANPYTHHITSPFTHTIIISKVFFKGRRDEDSQTSK